MSVPAKIWGLKVTIWQNTYPTHWPFCLIIESFVILSELLFITFIHLFNCEHRPRNSKTQKQNSDYFMT
ncbi:hypothetical protein DR864_05905 [Runella rosea]|uniref:Uncharacterized protein n=1 Tax=Runella rosea TaxID=2259595 RepID=A0A344TF76_9BACT|nr:hypothetical protein DR864_05905 [Runella rosea]